jgi:3-hydroxyacyl-CoA dehydrogenase
MSGNTEGPIAVVGAGSIGVAFAIVFALARLPVRIQDPDPRG